MQDMTSHDSAVGAKITQVFSVGKNNQARVSFMNLMICFVEDKYQEHDLFLQKNEYRNMQYYNTMQC